MRAIADTDLPFLARLYASTRADEMRQVDWPQQQVDDFLKSQFDAQHAHYQQHYPAASFDLIMLHGEPIGRLYIDDRADEIRIIDIALLPEYRGHGIGSDVLIDILHRAARDKKCIRIHVEHFNPAMRLYKRLGFVNLEDRGVYAFMEWKNTAGIQGDSAHG
jgi:ribosomal protein S18 acetylase RimI-like enzyme